MEDKIKTVETKTYKKAIIEMVDNVENVKTLKRIYDYVYRNIKRAGK
ncbi:hypothetical protein [Enterococcus plantarum]|nr:hypothetical protein [Enterococcus plantarum]